MTSVTPSSIHGAHPTKKAEKSNTSAGDTLGGSRLPGEFATLFGAISQMLPRQDLAAPAAGTGNASPPIEGLSSEVLGPRVQIITAAEPATSDESLLAFARAQGMDESSLALIFGQGAGAAPAATPDPTTVASQPSALNTSVLESTGSAADSPMVKGLWPGSHPAFVRPEPTAMAGTTDVATTITKPTEVASTIAGEPAKPATAANAADSVNALAGTQQAPGIAGPGHHPTTSQVAAAPPLPPFGSVPQAAQSGSAPQAAQSGSLDLGPDASVRWSVGDAPSAAAVAKALPPVLFGLNGVRAALQPAEAAEAAATHAAPPPQPEQQSLAASLMLGAAEASQFARKLQTRPGSARAESKDGVPAGAVGASPSTGKADDVVTDQLALDTGMSDADLQQLLQAAQQDNGQPASDSRQPAGGGLAGPTGMAADAAARTDLEQRAEQYEQLSQRLGEALGHRLASQIAKGDWKVEMALHPHDLGRIDIELNMKNGGLEASFSASQALTRDLITDGLPKLRDVLNQLGMDVASVNVNVRQNSQHGGNPTPGRQSPRVAGVGATRGPGTETAAAEVRPAPSAGSTDDGLDVLV